ncbi:MAG: hypothetical protein SNF93_00935 [Rikenellaceae bacterium]
MKRGLFAALALAAITFVGCQEQSELTPQASDDSSSDKITLFASSSISAPAAASTRVNFDEGSGEIVATWQNEVTKADSFSVYDAEGNYRGDFVYTGINGATSGTFEQDGTFLLEEGSYTAVIPASTCATLAERDAELTTASQAAYANATLEHLTNYMKMRAEFTFVPAEDAILAFEQELSMIKLSLKMPSGVVPAGITITDGAEGNSYYMKFPSGIANVVSTYIAVEPNTSQELREITFSVENSDTESTDVFADYTVTSSQLFEAAKYYSYDISYKADVPVIDYYEDGYTAPNGVTYSKDTEGVTLLTSTETLSNTAGNVYFLDPESSSTEFTMPAGLYSNTVIIGRYSDEQPVVNAAGIVTFGTGNGLIMKNVDFTGNMANYTFNYSDASGLSEYWVFEDCRIDTGMAGKSFSYFNKDVGSIENIIWRNNIVDLSLSGDDGADVRTIYFASCNAANYKYIELTNNLIFSSSGLYTKGPLITVALAAADELEIVLENNTFINFACSNNAFVTVSSAKGVTINDNIFWGDPAKKTTNYMFRYTVATAAPSTEVIDGNVFYGSTTADAWFKYMSSSTYIPTQDSNIYTKESINIFDSYTYALGSFVVNEAYADKGATIAWE